MFRSGVVIGAILACLLGGAARAATLDIDGTYNGSAGYLPLTGVFSGQLKIDTTPTAINSSPSFADFLMTGDIVFGTGPSSFVMILTSASVLIQYATQQRMFWKEADGANIYPIDLPESISDVAVFSEYVGPFVVYTTISGGGDLGHAFGNARHSLQLSGTITAVPEPGAWGLLLLGVGVTGASLRRRRARPAAAPERV